MRDRLGLILYVATVITATIVHSIGFLAVLLGVAFIAAGSARWRIARRALITIAVFNTLVTAGYVVLSLLQSGFSAHYVVLLNLRVFLLVFLTFVMGERIDWFRAFSFSPALTYMLVLTYSQVLTFQRILYDFRLALRSRMLARIRARESYRHAAVLSTFLLGKSLASATDVAQAMKSRGYFDD
jgi:cobalt/nickel transport system permease protein